MSNLEEVIELLGNEQFDIIIVEGFRDLVAKRKDILKIVTAKDKQSLKKLLVQTAQPIIAVTGIIGKQKPELELGIPVIEFPTEGEQLLALVRKYLKGKNC
jgi:molybdopterin-guanine dinucleotide biosynthesis protein